MNLPSEIRDGSRRLRELVGIHVYEYREKAKGYANSVRVLKPRQLAKVCDFWGYFMSYCHGKEVNNQRENSVGGKELRRHHLLRQTPCSTAWLRSLPQSACLSPQGMDPCSAAFTQCYGPVLHIAFVSPHPTVLYTAYRSPSSATIYVHSIFHLFLWGEKSIDQSFYLLSAYVIYHPR